MQTTQERSAIFFQKKSFLFSMLYKTEIHKHSMNKRPNARWKSKKSFVFFWKRLVSLKKARIFAPVITRYELRMWRNW